MAGSTQFGGLSGHGGIPTQGGRHVVRGTNGVIWMFVDETSGLNHELVCYFAGTGSRVATREVVRAASVLSILGVSCCVDTDDQPVVAYTEGATSGIKVSRRIADVWTTEASAATFHTSIAAHQILCNSSGAFELIYGDYRASLTRQQVQHRRSTDDLGTWAAPTTVDFNATALTDVTQERRVAACLDASDAIHAAWSIRTGSTWNVSYALYSGSWGSIETVDSPPFNSPAQQPRYISIAVDGSARPTCVWVKQGRTSAPGVTSIFHSRRHGSWSGALQIHDAPTTSQDKPSVTVNQAGYCNVFWIGDGLGGSATGHDSLMRAYGDGSSFAFARIVDPGSNVRQPETPHSWRPHGHGFFDSGYWCMYYAAGSVGFAESTSGTTWVHEPECANDLQATHAHSTAGSVFGNRNLLGVGQTVGVTVERTREAKNDLLVTHKFTLPRGGSVGLVGQSVSLAGSIWLRSAGNGLIANQAVGREYPPLCETAYVPNPAISASESASIYLAGPYPLSTRSIKLPAPALGDGRTEVLRIITLRSMGGEIQQAKKTTNLKRFTLPYAQLSRLKAVEVQDFFDAMVGELVRYSDVDGRLWKCAVLSAEIRIIQNGDYHHGQVEILLEGEAV